MGFFFFCHRIRQMIKAAIKCSLAIRTSETMAGSRRQEKGYPADYPLSKSAWWAGVKSGKIL